jgi:protein-disulfide isomerase
VSKRRALVALLAAALAGCGGAGPLAGSGLMTVDEAPGPTKVATPAMPGDKPPVKTAEGGFNPFAEQAPVSAGGREVIENPTLPDIALTGTLPEMAFGRADAPVIIVQYASMTCPHCRNFHMKTFPAFKKAYIDTGKVRYVLREFPIGKTSGAATIALRCAKPEKYLELYGKFMEQQPNWVSLEVRLDPIYKVASQVGMTRQQFDACRENQAMIDGLNWVKERGRKLGIIGTPNFFVGGKLVKKELSIEDIRAMVDPLVAARATAAAGKPH